MRRFALFIELEAIRANAPGYLPQFFGTPPVLAVYEQDGTAIDPRNISACDLRDWTPPANPAIRVAVDPELGRLVFNGEPPDPVRVAYAYAFSGPYGGGTYQRTPDPGEGAPQTVSSFAAADPASWRNGVFEIADSGSFLGNIHLSPDGSLVVRAADFVRPVVLGQVTIEATAGASVTLRGIGIRDGVVIRGSSSSSSSSSSSTSSGSSASSLTLSAGTSVDTAFSLNLEHCTLRGSVTWSDDEGGFLTIAASLCAALQIDDRVTISISDSAVDGGADAAIAIAAADGVSPCGEVDLSACTIIGAIVARETQLVEDSLLSGNASFERTQAGCVRYSYVPTGSTTPRRFRCQPDFAMDAAVATALKDNPSLSSAGQQAIRQDVASRVAPAFVSRVPGDAGYLQLSDRGPPEIASGAESGDEMGIFHGLYNGRRESNLVFRLSEYLRIGLEAGVIHAS